MDRAAVATGHGRRETARGDMEASQLGWLPGEWPLRFTRDGVEYVRVRAVRNETDGELVAMIYRGPDGKETEVLND
jgi:hypothetical protein